LPNRDHLASDLFRWVPRRRPGTNEDKIIATAATSRQSRIQANGPAKTRNPGTLPSTLVSPGIGGDRIEVIGPGSRVPATGRACRAGCRALAWWDPPGSADEVAGAGPGGDAAVCARP